MRQTTRKPAVIAGLAAVLFLGIATLHALPAGPGTGATAATARVSGVVTDGSGQGWPLYARIDIAGRAAPVFTNPVTGEYAVDLTEGQAYTFTVTAVMQGYRPSQLTVTPAAGGTQQDFALTVDAATCSASGYAQPHAYFEDFENGDGGWTTTVPSLWQSGSPTRGPGSAHSGGRAWGTYLAGALGALEGDLLSPSIDLSSYGGQFPLLTWWQYLRTAGGQAKVEVSKDGGTTWAVIYGEVGNVVDLAWTKKTVALAREYAVPDFRVRFHFRGAVSTDAPGWYIDDVGLTVVAPGATVYTESFEASNGGYTAGGTASSWEWGVPTSGPGAAHSGTKAWATNLAGNHNGSENSSLTSPAVNLSMHAGNWLLVSWWQAFYGGCGYWGCGNGSVEASSSSGTWSSVYGPFGGPVDPSWAAKSALLPPSFAFDLFQLRFLLTGSTQYVGPGYYVDDVVIRVASVPCEPVAGGLVVGFVRHASSGLGLTNATVTSDSAPAETTTTVATPADTAVGDGFYSLFSSYLGNVSFTAAKAGYGVDTRTVNVVAGSVAVQDFGLVAPNPVPSLTSLVPVQVKPGAGPITITLTGANFIPVSKVLWNGAERQTTFLNTTTLQAVLGAGDLSSRGVGAVVVRNPTPGGGTSNALPLVIGAAGKDFNVDGYADIVWESSQGWVAIWIMNGTTQIQNALLYNYPVAVGGWHIVGTGDFNGDGHSDLLWQSDSGYVAAWLMNGTTQVANLLLYDRPVAVDGWHIVGTGDLDGDDKTDILWQDNRGYVAYWLMDGLTQRANALLDPRPVAAGGWQIVGTGDLNGDGSTDLVWQSPQGYVAAWIMNGLVQVSNQLLYQTPVATQGWTIAGTADMNGDGMVDILWQKRPTSPTDKDAGWLATWLMNGPAHAATAVLTPSRVTDLTWKIVGPK